MGSQGSGWPWIFALFVLAGVGLMVFGIIFYRRGTARFGAAKAWAPGQALIKVARLDSHTQMVNNMVQTTYRPYALYGYHAGGADREGTRVFLVARPDWNSEKEAKAWLAACPTGAQVPLWFDPANPEDSALILNKPSLFAAIMLTGTGAFLIVMGIYAMMRLSTGS